MGEPSPFAGFGSYLWAVALEVRSVRGVPEVWAVLGFLFLASSIQVEWVKRQLARLPRFGLSIAAFLDHPYTRRFSFGLGVLAAVVLVLYVTHRAHVRLMPPAREAAVVSQIVVAKKDDLADRERQIAALKEQGLAKEREVDRAQTELRAAQARIGSLESQLAEVQRRLDDKERRRAGRTEITRLMTEGENLKRTLRGPGDKEARQAQAEAWAARTRQYLQTFEPSYVARFNAPALQFTFTTPDVPAEVNGLWNGINQRTAELGKFLEELKE